MSPVDIYIWFWEARTTGTKSVVIFWTPQEGCACRRGWHLLFGLGWVMNPPPEMKRDLYRVIPLLDWCECGVWQVWVASAGCVGVYAPESAYLHTMHHPKPVFPMLCCYWYGAAANSMMTTWRHSDVTERVSMWCMCSLGDRYTMFSFFIHLAVVEKIAILLKFLLHSRSLYATQCDYKRGKDLLAS